MANDPIVNVNLPGEPARKVTTQTPSVTKKVRTPGVDQAISAFDKAAGDQDVFLGQQAHAQEDINRVGEVGAIEEGILAERRQQQHAGAQIEYGKQIDELKRVAADKRKAAEVAGNIEPLMSGWKGVLAGVLQGFAQYYHTRAGGQGLAPGIEAFNAAAARDRQAKIDAFTRSKEFAELAQQDVNQAELALRQRLSQIDNDHIVAGNLLTKRLAAMASKFKTAEARASADATAAAIRAANAEKQARMEGDFAAQVTKHGVSTTETQQTAPDGKPTATSQLGAARAGLILDTLQDAMNNPTISKEGLSTLRTNRARLEAGRQAPLVEAAVGTLTGGKAGLAPLEGEQQGLSQPDRQALARQSVLNETVTYLTTGAAATKQEAESKTGQLQINPDDNAATVRTKLTNAYRYAKAAATIGRQSMTPEHLQRLQELGVALGLEKPAAGPAAPGGAAPAPPAAGAPAPRQQGNDGNLYELRDGLWYPVVQ